VLHDNAGRKAVAFSPGIDGFARPAESGKKRLKIDSTQRNFYFVKISVVLDIYLILCLDWRSSSVWQTAAGAV
jgi:hypothetical protein